MALDSLTGRFKEVVPSAQGQDQHLMSVAQVNCSFYFKYIRKRFKKATSFRKLLAVSANKRSYFENMYLFIHNSLEKFDI